MNSEETIFAKNKNSKSSICSNDINQNDISLE